MIELPTLYDHQANQKDAIRTSFAGYRRVILQGNPGQGKTRMAKWIMGAALNRKEKSRILFCVHRRGLVDNAINSFAEIPELPHGVIMSGRETSYRDRIQVASIDSLLSWFCDGDEYQNDLTFDLIIFDECHSHHSKLAKFLKCHDAKREKQNRDRAFLIGLTATPSAKGLADVYEKIVMGPSTDWLINQGYLSPYRYMSGKQGRLGLLVKRGIEYTKDSTAAAMAGLSGDLVRDWMKHAQGRATIGFFSRIAQSKEAMELLQSEGVEVAHLDGSTSDDERADMYRAISNGSLDYICNVGVVERGTDIPRIGAVQLCLPVGSLVRFRQMIGRGSRVHPAKENCLVLDHGGNIKRHGFFEDDPPWSLDWTTKQINDSATRPTIECPQCQAIYRGGLCVSCGYEPTRGERKAVGLEFDGTQLKEIVRKPKTKPYLSNEKIMTSALYAIGRSGGTFRQAIAVAYSKAKQCGNNNFRIPRKIEVGSREVHILPKGHPDQNRRVRTIYPWTVK